VEKSLDILVVVLSSLLIIAVFMMVTTHLKPPELEGAVVGVTFEKDERGVVTSLAIANAGEQSAEDFILKVYVNGKEYDYPLDLEVGPDRFEKVDLRQVIGERLDQAEMIEIYMGNELLGRKVQVR